MSLIQDAVNVAKNVAQKAGEGVVAEVKEAASQLAANPSNIKEIAQELVTDAKSAVVGAVTGSETKEEGLTLRVKDASGAVVYEGNVSGAESLLDECGSKGVDLPFSCHAGACMSCAAQITCGRDLVNHEKFGKQYIETDDDTVLTCIAAPKDGAKGTIEMTMLM